jgi:hypothetical protein
MSKEVSFSFDTEADKTDFAVYAKAKGMTLSTLAKAATYAFRAKNRAGGHHLPGRRGAKVRPIPGGQESGQLDGT